MKNTIIKTNGSYKERLVITDDAIILGPSTIKSIEKFIESSNKSGKIKSVSTIPLSGVKKISFNEKGEQIKIEYTNKKGKDKKESISLKDDSSPDLGHYLGGSLQMKREEVIENKLLKLLPNAALCLGLIILAIYLGLGDHFDSFINEETTTSGRSGRRLATAKAILSSLGKFPTLIILGAAGMFFGWTAWKRYSRPAREVTYTKV